MVVALKRTTRQAPGRLRLMPRELDALAFIAAAQPVATPAYQEFLGVSSAVARRSLRKLRDLGLVNVFITSLEAPSRFGLTKRAAVLLAETLDRSEGDFRVLRGIGKVPLRHHDGVAHLAASLHRACRASRAFTLASFECEDAIRRRLRLTKAAQIPDAVAVLAGPAPGTASIAWAIEQDEATESTNYVVEKKAKPYADLQARQVPLAGVASWYTVCVVPTEGRLKRLVAALYEAGIPEGQWYFAVKSEVRSETVLTSAWRTVRTTPDGQQAELVSEPPLPIKPVTTTCHNRCHGRGA